MRIVDRETFLGMGEVVYSLYQPWALRGLYIKERTIGDTGVFCKQSLIDPFMAENRDEREDILDELEWSGMPIKLNFEGENREVLYDENQLFAVWGKEDVLGLINRLKKLV